ncbi:hypothetical protein OJAV_G00008290 [Oryzias javanicus]|uniref:Uncharacterized protein n=1 Tax=Oryzias javanicus TaxID=123683 RepID=A0A437DN77_ORYJA|nr:hypothetical protein OJAV_G00008290 [Oryzias javanicus]
MATKPVVWQARGPPSSLDELQSEETASRRYDCSPTDRKAPKAVPEEDIDVLESGVDARAPEENMSADPTMESANDGQMAQKAAIKSEHVPTQQSDVICSQYKHTNQVDVEDCDFPPPPSPGSLSAGGHLGREGLSHLEEKLEGAPSPQSSHQPPAGNQEAEQQVFGEGPPPLSAVAMEMWGQGGADSEVRVSAAGERRSRVGERAEGEKQQTEVCQEIRRQAGYTETDLQQNRHKMEKDMFDDSQSDSGVSADFSPYSSMDIPFTALPGTASAETPIQREIRRAIEREHSLRRSRGLPNRPTSPEYVEIPLRKTVLSQSLTTKAEWSQNKDREFAGKKMQQEINKEAQREHDLVKMGKIPGVYDRGTAGQLKERKQVFEAFQATCDSTFLMSVKNHKSQSSVSSDGTDASTLEETKSEASTCKDSEVERRPSFDLLTQSPTRGGLTGPSFRHPDPSRQTGQQVIVLEHGMVPAQKSHLFKAEKVSVIESESSPPSWNKAGWRDAPMGRQWGREAEEEITPKQNPFFKLRSSDHLVKVKQEILQAQEREREFRNQRISLYGGGGEPIPAGPSSKGGTEPSAGQQSMGKLSVWPPSQMNEEEINRSEVFINSRTPRQKTPLVQRWEAGLVNGFNREDP